MRIGEAESWASCVFARADTGPRSPGLAMLQRSAPAARGTRWSANRGNGGERNRACLRLVPDAGGAER